MESFLAINFIFEDRRPQPHGVTQGVRAEPSPWSCVGSTGLSRAAGTPSGHSGAAAQRVGQEVPAGADGSFPCCFAILGSCERCGWRIRLWLRIPAQLTRLHGPEPHHRPGCSREGWTAAPCLLGAAVTPTSPHRRWAPKQHPSQLGDGTALPVLQWELLEASREQPGHCCHGGAVMHHQLSPCVLHGG